jgi:hypothetical protein
LAFFTNDIFDVELDEILLNMNKIDENLYKFKYLKNNTYYVEFNMEYNKKNNFIYKFNTNNYISSYYPIL